MTFPPLRARAPAAACLLACLLICPATHAGRPMTVDDAAIAAPGQCQLETYALRADDLAEYWITPACNVGAAWELAVGGAWADDRSGPRGRTAHYGRVQAKTVFKPLQTNGWGLGLVLADQFRAGRGGDGDLSLNVPLSISVRDDALLLHFNAGVMHAETGRQHHATWGSGAQFRLDERHTLTAEAYGRQHSGARYQFGIARALIADRLQIDATWGRRLARGGGEAVLTLGLVFQSN